MFERLKTKWQVSGWQLFVILWVFAITGTTTAYVSKAITGWIGFDHQTFWVWRWLLRIAVLLFGYQIILLFVAFLLGQFSFFWKYEKKLLTRMRLLKTSEAPVMNQPINHTPFKIAIFASGAGSNAEQIINHFKNSSGAQVALVACNKPEAGVLHIAAREGVPALIIEKERFFRGDGYVPQLQAAGIDWIVLAGFLWKVPQSLINAYRGKIINIHPALLPKYGGKGMYGSFVHQAVIESAEPQSGITIHYVDEHYDNGDIIFQAHCPVHKDDTPHTLAQRIHGLEHQHYPMVIEQLLSGKPVTG